MKNGFERYIKFLEEENLLNLNNNAVNYYRLSRNCDNINAIKFLFKRKVIINNFMNKMEWLTKDLLSINSYDLLKYLEDNELVKILDFGKFYLFSIR